MCFKKKILFLLFVFAFLFIKAQTDTIIVDTISIHSPKKATLYSTFLPGLGQIYNKKYWKVPVLYGLLGTFTYFVIYNDHQYMIYRQAYRDRIDGFTQQQDEGEYIDVLSNDQLKSEMKRWERSRNFNAIGIFLTYIANIIDANVDAHFFDYDISDDLSLRIMPVASPVISENSQFGVTCVLSF